MSLEAKNIKTIEDMQIFVEGCINDFESGISTKEETIRFLKEYTFRVIELSNSVINWVAFDFHKLETRPPKYGKYLITRKDGKIHWETWNGSGWAYNHKEIRYWAEIKPPC